MFGITIERREEEPVCDEKMAVVGRAASRKAQRQHDAQVAADAVRAFQGGQPKVRKEHGPAYVTLCVVAGIVLLASMHAILHLLSVVLLIVAVAGVTAVVAWATRGLHLPRRRRVVVPAPTPELTPQVQAAVAEGLIGLPLPAAQRAVQARVTRRVGSRP